MPATQYNEYTDLYCDWCRCAEVDWTNAPTVCHGEQVFLCVDCYADFRREYP